MKSVRILVVDDDTAFRATLERILGMNGLLVIQTASSGELALEMVKKQAPDLVLLDLYLPEMNGLKAIREIHKIDHKIPILMLTSEADEDHRDLALKLGARAYLTKPVTLRTLVGHIGEALGPSFGLAA
jgi:DNA-binding response OmpR family regulator